MMGRLKRNQGQFFYSFCLDEVVPDDHPVREIAGVLDLSWVCGVGVLLYARIVACRVSSTLDASEMRTGCGP
jgi:hypothetical protein